MATPTGHALQLAAEPGAGAAALTDEQAAKAVHEALALWQAAGFDTSTLSSITVQLADLPGSFLGLAGDGTIWLDVDAAGYGWSLTGAAGRVDLLTVAAHELGHLLGFEHDDADDVMGDLLGLGERRLPGPAAVLPTDPLDLAFADLGDSLIDLVLGKERDFGL